MKVLNEELIQMIKDLVEAGVVDFEYWPKSDHRETPYVEIVFQDDNCNPVKVQVNV